MLLPFLILISAPPASGDPDGTRPLLLASHGVTEAAFPSDSWVLDDPESIESFLTALDQAPPDWRVVYGSGEHGHGHDDRLFALNRERDRLREGRATLDQVVTFLWPGELSDGDPASGGFRVAVGPKVIFTKWGWVRFKPDDLPANLIAVPPSSMRDTLHERRNRGERIDVTVAMTGRLIPEESIIYDFAHEEPGQGMIMPVVRVQRIDYLLFE